jgi:hypothetical protein
VTDTSIPRISGFSTWPDDLSAPKSTGTIRFDAAMMFSASSNNALPNTFGFRIAIRLNLRFSSFTPLILNLATVEHHVMLTVIVRVDTDPDQFGL